ncbi:PDC sensor domain-containing protein [Dawidia soli]|uniref:Uncharacterized protein n=1 Tax=Dawidia soli TaxID=2782352 RepID=A0AAP2DIL9_9BACT|nr:hypothetical protein [Dawidia soli]MBT1690057.1 hypothetical protein [Dawidia soli]
MTKNVNFRKIFIAFASIAGVSILAYYYLVVVAPARERELNQRGFRILTRIERNIHDKKNNVHVILDDVYGKKSMAGERYSADDTIGYFDGLRVKGTLLTTVWKHKFQGRKFVPTNNRRTNKWFIRFFGYQYVPKPGGGPYDFVRSDSLLEYHYDAEKYLADVVGYRQDFFEDYVVLYGDSAVYQTRPLDLTPAFRTVNNKRVPVSNEIRHDTLGGKPYVIYYHAINKASEVPFVLCGLISEEKYQHDRNVIDTDKIIWISLLTLLALCSLPYLKVFLIGPLERVYHHDVIGLGVASLLGAAVIVTMLVLWMHNMAERQQQECTLRHVSSELKRRVQGEVADILLEIDQQEMCYMPAPTSGAYRTWLRENLRGPYSERMRTLDRYFNNASSWHPVISMLFIDENGQNWGTWMNKGNGRADMDLRARDYVNALPAAPFKLVSPWDSVVRTFYLQPVYSWHSQENTVVVSKTPNKAAQDLVDSLGLNLRDDLAHNRWPRGDTRGHLRVLALETLLLSAMQPAMSAEVQFCILDAGGNVLFHSDGRRNLRENFPEESSKPALVRALIESRSSRFEKIFYYGQYRLMHFSPMQDLPYTAVVMYDSDAYIGTLSNEVMFTLFMLCYLTLGIALLILVPALLGRRPSLLKRSKIDLKWLRPHTGQQNFTLLLVVLLVPTALAAGQFITESLLYRLSGERLSLSTGTLLYLSFAFPVLTVSLTGAAANAIALTRRADQIVLRPLAQWPFRLLFFLCGLAALLFCGLLWLLEGLYLLHPAVLFTALLVATSGWLFWRPHALMPVLVALRAPSTLDRMPWLKKPETSRRVTAVLMLTVLNLSILPTFGFFRTAIRVENSLHEKRGALAIAEGIEQRQRWLVRNFPDITRRWEQLATEGRLPAAPATASATAAGATTRIRPRVAAMLDEICGRQRQLRQLGEPLHLVHAGIYKSGNPDDRVELLNAQVLDIAEDRWRWSGPQLVDSVTSWYLRLISLPRMALDTYETRNLCLDRTALLQNPYRWWWGRGPGNAHDILYYHYGRQFPSEAYAGVAVALPSRIEWELLEFPARLKFLLVVVMICIGTYCTLHTAYKRLLLVGYFEPETLRMARQTDTDYIRYNAVHGPTNLLVLAPIGTRVITVIRETLSTAAYTEADPDPLLVNKVGHVNFTGASRKDMPNQIVLLPYFDLREIAGGKRIEYLKTLSQLFQRSHTKVIWVTSGDPGDEALRLAKKYLAQRTASADDSPLQQEQEKLLQVLDDFDEVNYPLDQNDPTLFRDYKGLRIVTDEFRFGAYFARLFHNIVSHGSGQYILHTYFKKDNNGHWTACEPRSEEMFVLKIQELAGNYYHSLWASLTSQEKYVLYDLAQDELTNYLNYPVLSSLQRRGLLYVSTEEKALHIFNRSFRNFILSVVNPEDALQLEREINVTGTWDTIRMVLIIFFVSMGAFLLYTQQTVFNQVTGFVTTLTGLVPTLTGFFSTMRSVKGKP